MGFARANDAASIICVRCGGGFAFDPGGDDPDRGPSTGGFGMLAISCVPGAFFEGVAAAPGGGGLVPVRGRGTPACEELGALGGMRSPAAFWNAPRCDSALLTASGDTTGGAGAVPSSAPGPPAAAGPEGGFDVVAGGGPYGDPIAREAGDAVAANGFTGGEPAGSGGPYAVDGTLICGVVGAGAGELAGPLPPSGSARFSEDGSVGAPHAAQNFREPMSSAPHFAHFVIFEIPS